MFNSPYESIKHYTNFYYFTQGNFFTGSLGNIFNYRIEVDKENNSFVVYTYTGGCFEICENEEKELFEFSEDGLDAAAKWIALKYTSFLEEKEI